MIAELPRIPSTRSSQNSSSRETVWKLREGSISWSQHGAKRVHNGRKSTLLGASRYRQSLHPTRPATFQTVSLERWVNEDHHVLLRLLVNDELAPAKLVRC